MFLLDLNRSLLADTFSTRVNLGLSLHISCVPKLRPTLLGRGCSGVEGEGHPRANPVCVP